MDAGRDLPEVVELLPCAKADDGVRRIRRLKADAVLVAAVGLHGEVSVHACDDHIAVCWAEGAVDNEQVAIGDARAGHRVALDAHEVSGGGPPHEKLVEVERRLEVLLGRRGEPRHNGTGNFSLRALRHILSSWFKVRVVWSRIVDRIKFD